MRLVQVVVIALVFVIGSGSVWAAKPIKDAAEQPVTAKAYGKGKKTKTGDGAVVIDEPIAEAVVEPVVEEPIAEVVAEPVVDPVVAEPVVEPVVEEPIAEVIEEPVAVDPIVEPEATQNSLLLSWVAPATRENGDALALSDIAGYEIYYTSDMDASGVVVIDGAQITEYSIDGLFSDTYHFAISTLDISGLKSEMSEVISISVQ